MDKEKSIEILKNIVLSTKDKNIWTVPSNIKYYDYKGKSYDVTYGSKEFVYILNNGLYSDTLCAFKVFVIQIPRYYFLSNWSDGRSKYITKIDILSRDNRHHTFETKDQLLFEDDETQYIQKDLFKYLMDRNNLEVKAKDNIKIDSYLEESKKLFSKQILRDSKINDLLS